MSIFVAAGKRPRRPTPSEQKDRRAGDVLIDGVRVAGHSVVASALEGGVMADEILAATDRALAGETVELDLGAGGLVTVAPAPAMGQFKSVLELKIGDAVKLPGDKGFTVLADAYAEKGKIVLCFRQADPEELDRKMRKDPKRWKGGTVRDLRCLIQRRFDPSDELETREQLGLFSAGDDVRDLLRKGLRTATPAGHILVTHGPDTGVLICGDTKSNTDVFKRALAGRFKIRSSAKLPDDCGWYVQGSRSWSAREKAKTAEAIATSVEDLALSQGRRISVALGVQGKQRAQKPPKMGMDGPLSPRDAAMVAADEARGGPFWKPKDVPRWFSDDAVFGLDGGDLKTLGVAYGDLRTVMAVIMAASAKTNKSDGAWTGPMLHRKLRPYGPESYTAFDSEKVSEITQALIHFATKRKIAAVQWGDKGSVGFDTVATDPPYNQDFRVFTMKGKAANDVIRKLVHGTAKAQLDMPTVQRMVYGARSPNAASMILTAVAQWGSGRRKPLKVEWSSYSMVD